MDLSGLTEHLAAVEDDAALELPIGGRTYRVRPPSAAVGARCAALWASRDLEGDEQAAAVEEALAGTTVPVLTLGAELVDRMTADGVPAVVVRECGTVALVAWTLGSSAAQRYVDGMVSRRDEPADAEGKAKRPASRRRRKSGTSTA